MPSVKKPAAPAKKTSASRALTLWEQKMAESAQKTAQAERPVGGLAGIHTRGGIMTIDERPVKDNQLDCVVLLAVHENQWFTRDFDPNVPASPDCYAFGDPDLADPEGAMAPHPDAVDKQGDDNGLCNACPLNKMGSAEKGRGKACRNVRRLALVTTDALESPEAMEDAEVRVLKVPVMSVKGWAQYVRQTLAEDMKRPYWGVVTRIKIVPDQKSQFRVTFLFEQLIDFDDKLFAAVERKIESLKPQLTAPYPKFSEEAPPPPPPTRGGRGRAAPEAPVKPVGRAAQAMAKAAAKTAGSRSKF